MRRGSVRFGPVRRPVLAGHMHLSLYIYICICIYTYIYICICYIAGAAAAKPEPTEPATSGVLQPAAQATPAVGEPQTAAPAASAVGLQTAAPAASAIGEPQTAAPAALDEAGAESEARRVGVDNRDRDERAAWMRFHRSLQTGQRKARGEKCPDHIKEGMNREPLKHGYYMDLWVSQKESWGAVVAYERRYSLDVTGTKITEQWLTEGQLMGIYQDKTAVQAHG